LRAVLSVPVELIDESFTTVEAEDVLLQADLSRARRKQVVDRVAAAVILRRWMDAEAARKRLES
jgi:putative pre-16S rRNA nuclease